MASNRWTKNHPLSQSLHLPVCFLLFLVLTLPSTSKGSDPTRYYKGEVGGNVTLPCPVDKDKEVTFMYLQKPSTDGPEIFVNGYSSLGPTDNIWENTQLVHHKSAVHMSNLNVSHAGDYKCIIKYNLIEKVNQTELHLSVTAPYKNPQFTNSCKEEDGVLGCHVTCMFHHGYPGKEIQWKRAGNGSTKMGMTNGSVQDPNTQLFDISSTAYFNCSDGEQTVFCYVEDDISIPILVCPSEVKPFPTNVIAAITVTVVTVLAIALVMVMCCIQKKKRALSGQSPAINLEEDLALNQIKTEKS